MLWLRAIFCTPEEAVAFLTDAVVSREGQEGKGMLMRSIQNPAASACVMHSAALALSQRTIPRACNHMRGRPSILVRSISPANVSSAFDVQQQQQGISDDTRRSSLHTHRVPHRMLFTFKLPKAPASSSEGSGS